MGYNPHAKMACARQNPQSAGALTRPFVGHQPINSLRRFLRITAMKTRNVLVMFFAGLSLCVAVMTARAQLINIMPMGDSVTARGGSPESSYRYWLYVDLTNAGYSDSEFAFVGNTTGNGGASDGPPANSWPDDEYEGGSSPGPDAWTTVTGVDNAASAAGILNSGSPSGTIVLLDLGANDLNEGEPLKTNLLEVQDNLETIIQTFAQANSGTVILLAVPTGWLTDPPDPLAKKYMSSLSSAVSKAASDQRKAGVDVEVVNLFGGYNVRTDTKDGTHPDIKGEQEIARKYFNALRPVLKKMGVVAQRAARR